jgi:hypothetical protein
MRSTSVVGSALALLLVAGCSSFERDWKALGPYPEAYSGIEGRWEGSWSCEWTGHAGGLRCLVSRLENDRYAMRYEATWTFLFTFTSEYTIAVEAERDGERMAFAGDAYLGLLVGGDCHHQGEATAEELRATYESSSNRGTFVLRRPGRAPAPAATEEAGR